ncbi:MAG: hypothetical protein QW738_09590 [Nitrososphaeria archaeon]
MNINFNFSAWGILALAALALFLSFSSYGLGQSVLSEKFFSLGVFIIIVFITYMFAKLFLNGEGLL